jgi:hypothetical protein
MKKKTNRVKKSYVNRKRAKERERERKKCRGLIDSDKLAVN